MNLYTKINKKMKKKIDLANEISLNFEENKELTINLSKKLVKTRNLAFD